MKEERILRLSNRNINKKIISKIANEVMGNIPILSNGRTTGLNTILKSLRDA